jgi:predicted dehydrogenase
VDDGVALTGVVVAGTGFGCVTHVRALRNAGFDVRAVVGRDPDRTAARAAAFDVPIASTSFRDALALPGVDAVTIATPPHTHADLVLEALAAGKHVLCEKPLGRDAKEATHLLERAEAAGVVHLLGTEFRFDEGQALLARVVRDGTIGEARLALFVLHVPMLADPASDAPAWWTQDAQGGGWLGAHGSQVIDQIRVTLGEFARVTAALVRLSDHGWTADDGFVVRFELQSGLVGVMQSTAADWGAAIIETRVIGTRGTAWIEGLGANVFVADADGTRAIELPGELRTVAPEPLPRGILQTTYERMTGHGLDLGPYTRLAEHFRARIEGDDSAATGGERSVESTHGKGRAAPAGPAPATFADGVAAMAVLDAMRQSARSGGTVEMGA